MPNTREITVNYIKDRAKFIVELAKDNVEFLLKTIQEDGAPNVTELGHALSEQATLLVGVADAMRQLAQAALLQEGVYCECGEEGYTRKNGKVLCADHYEKTFTENA